SPPRTKNFSTTGGGGGGGTDSSGCGIIMFLSSYLTLQMQSFIVFADTIQVLNSGCRQNSWDIACLQDYKALLAVGVPNQPTRKRTSRMVLLPKRCFSARRMRSAEHLTASRRIQPPSLVSNERATSAASGG